MSTKTAVCDRCQSQNVYSDAWVGINDPENIVTFDASFCADCQDRTTIVWLAQPHNEE